MSLAVPMALLVLWEIAGMSRALASGVRTKRIRAGQEFALVGPERMIS